jgi:hypothetical protein
MRVDEHERGAAQTAEAATFRGFRVERFEAHLDPQADGEALKLAQHLLRDHTRIVDLLSPRGKRTAASDVYGKSAPTVHPMRLG